MFIPAANVIWCIILSFRVRDDGVTSYTDHFICIQLYRKHNNNKGYSNILMNSGTMCEFFS